MSGIQNEHNRIETKDITNLNLEIEKMNAEGWQVKQIQNIDSGNSYITSYREGGAGYGYSFTEGILIVWEKED